MTLSKDERERYARHFSLPGVGEEGQKRISAAKVLIVGAGGLGSPAALYLAAAGVGTLAIADPDTVDISNLQRQVLHDTPSAGKPKVDSAAARLGALNPGVRVVKHGFQIDASNAREIIGKYDIVVDGTDRVATRYLLNDACYFEKKPLVHGAVYRFEGQASVFAPGGPCYRCVFPAPGMEPASCSSAGVLGVLPGLIGVIQATETLKLILGMGRSLAGRLLLVNAQDMSFHEMALERDPDCPLCGSEPAIHEIQEIKAECPDGKEVAFIETGELHSLVSAGRAPVLLDVREANEWKAGHLPGAVWIPLGQLAGRLAELDSARETVTYCRTGNRSGVAAGMLAGKGFRKVRNLAGGIMAWKWDVTKG